MFAASGQTLIRAGMGRTLPQTDGKRSCQQPAPHAEALAISILPPCVLPVGSKTRPPPRVWRTALWPSLGLRKPSERRRWPSRIGPQTRHARLPRGYSNPLLRHWGRPHPQVAETPHPRAPPRLKRVPERRRLQPPFGALQQCPRHFCH